MQSSGFEIRMESCHMQRCNEFADGPRVGIGEFILKATNGVGKRTSLKQIAELMNSQLLAARHGTVRDAAHSLDLLRRRLALRNCALLRQSNRMSPLFCVKWTQWKCGKRSERFTHPTPSCRGFVRQTSNTIVMCFDLVESFAFCFFRLFERNEFSISLQHEQCLPKSPRTPQLRPNSR